MVRGMKRADETALLEVAAALAAGAEEDQAAAGPYVINSVEFEITGITRKFLLRNKADVKVGKSLPDLPALEAYIADRRQGLLLSVRGRDYNFLGSMQKLALNLNYERDENGRNGFGIGTSFSIPFLAAGHEWSTGVSQDFYYYPDGTPNTFTTSASLGVTFRELGFQVSFSLSQGVSLNTNGVTDDPDPYYLSSSASLSASIPTGLELGALDEVSYAPFTFFAYNWAFSGTLEEDDRSGPSRLDGETAVFLNLDLPIKLFDFPTHAIIGKDWLDFELEFLVFPARLRSFIVRGNGGFDLDALLRNKSLMALSPRDGASPYEMYFGLGHLY